MARPTLFKQLTRIGLVSVVVAGAAGVLLSRCSNHVLLEADRTRGRAEMARRVASTLEAYDNELLLVARRLPGFYEDKPILLVVEREHGLEALHSMLEKAANAEPALVALKDYRDVGERVISLIKLVGFEELGVEGEMRDVAHRLEDRLPVETRPAALAYLLQMRRHEKDFMRRMHERNVSLHHGAALHLREALGGDTAAQVDLDLYENTFARYVLLTGALGGAPTEGLLARQVAARTYLEKCLSDWGRIEAKRQLELLAQASWLWGVSLLLALAVMLLAGWVVARGLNDVLRDVAHAARAIGRGDLSRRAPSANTEEVNEVAEAINAMAEDLEQVQKLVQARTVQLERTNAELEDFCSSVSHDLRAPLRSMSGFAGALLDDFAEKLPPQAADYCRRIQRGSGRMSALVDDLLRLARVNRSALRWEQVDLTRLAREAADAVVKDPTNRREVEMVIEPGMEVSGDRGLLEAALANLLSNAVKFSRQAEAPRVEVARAPGRPNGFFVRDNGVGFDMAYADKLFKVFQRLHGQEIEGTGIGLATVKRVVERHGGRVWAESAPGAGATFFFTLSPTKPEEEELALIPPPQRML